MKMKIWFLLLSLTGAMADEEIVHRRVTKIPLRTSKSNRYQFVRTFYDKVIQFRVKALCCAYILIAPNYDSDYAKMLEVVLGHSYNTKSSIRQNNRTLQQIDTPDILNSNEYKDFYVRAYQTLSGKLVPQYYVDVGSGIYNTTTPFLSTAVNDEGGIKRYTAFASESVAEWEVEVTQSNSDPEVTKHVYSFPGDEYQFFPVEDKLVVFGLATAQNAHIALTSSFEDRKPIIEVKLATGSNQEYVTFTKDRSDNAQAAIKLYPTLDEKKLQWYWITWDNTDDQKLLLKFGLNNYAAYRDNPLLTYTFDGTMDIRCFGIKTPSTKGLWMLKPSKDLVFKDYYDHNRKRRYQYPAESSEKTSQEKEVKNYNIKANFSIVINES